MGLGFRVYRDITAITDNQVDKSLKNPMEKTGELG